jgi:IPT/TIG domain-containing protein
MSMVRYPLPITNAMLLPANENITKPRYNTPGDWSMGATGNDVDTATRSVAIAGPDSTNIFTPYPIRTQAGKAAAMTTALGYPATGVPILADIGIDYGSYAGQTSRSGTITPQAPYPTAASPPAVASVTPNTGLAAGGTSVTISGTGFTGATGVTFGGTAATAVVVVNANTITATSPAKAAGTYDVRVTTPNGTSPIAGSADNFIYT